MKTFTLNNGHTIPGFGYGTWQTPADLACKSVEYAIRCGFRHIDGAAMYKNEVEVGTAIRKCIEDGTVKRGELFVTSKVWNTERGYDKTLKAFDRSFSDLGLEYIDLYLIHWPANPFQFDNWKQINADTWRAMESLVKEGRVRSIGLSNFMPRHIKPLLENVEIAPAVNQIEYHPGWIQSECVEFCKELGMVIEAWSPLGGGGPMNHPQIVNLAHKYGRTPAQIIYAWIMANDIIPLSKSVTPERIESNFASCSFTMSDEDVKEISALGYCGGKCRNPDLVAY